MKYNSSNPVIPHASINYERAEYKEHNLINMLARKEIRKFVEKKKFIARITDNNLYFISNKRAKKLNLI